MVDEVKYDRLKVSVISSKGTLFEGEADFIEVPGKEGLFGILPGHTKLVSLLREGKIVVKNGESASELDVTGGICQITRDRVTFLV